MLTCGTDSQGNSYLLDKLLTTKYRLGAVRMELSSQLGRGAATLRADCIPRYNNEEAVALTNSDVRLFDPDRRVEVVFDNLGFVVMIDLYTTGENYLKELAELKTRSKAPALSSEAGPPRNTKARRVPLRESKPW